MDSGKQTSPSLLERARAKDADAWKRLVRLYTPLVVYWCHGSGVKGADAEDVCQEVFRAVAAHLGDYRHETFRGWLRGIARHKILDHFRGQQRQPLGQGGSEANERLLQVPEQGLLSDDSEEEVSGLYHRALEQVRGEFEGNTWQAFWRAAVEGQSPSLIAADLGVTPAAVRKAKSRVLLRLREEIGDLID